MQEVGCNIGQAHDLFCESVGKIDNYVELVKSFTHYAFIDRLIASPAPLFRVGKMRQPDACYGICKDNTDSR